MANPVNYIIQDENSFAMMAGMTWQDTISQMVWSEMVCDSPVSINNNMQGNCDTVPTVLRMRIVALPGYIVAAKDFTIAGLNLSPNDQYGNYQLASGSWYCYNFFWYHAADLPIGSLPQGVESICIYDTINGGGVGSSVYVTATMKSDWVAPMENVKFTIDIDGDACEIASGTCIPQCQLDFFGLDEWNPLSADGYVSFDGPQCANSGSDMSFCVKHNNIQEGTTIGYSYEGIVVVGNFFGIPMYNLITTTGTLGPLSFQPLTTNVENQVVEINCFLLIDNITSNDQFIAGSGFPFSYTVVLDEYDSNGIYVGDLEFRTHTVNILPSDELCPDIQGCTDDGSLLIANGDLFDSPYPGYPALNYDAFSTQQSCEAAYFSECDSIPGIYAPCVYKGCMDVEAINYNPLALDTCDGCCIYPPTQIKITASVESDSNLKITAMPTSFIFNSNNSGTEFEIIEGDSNSATILATVPAGNSIGIDNYAMPWFKIEPINENYSLSRFNLSIDQGVAVEQEVMFNNGGSGSMQSYVNDEGIGSPIENEPGWYLAYTVNENAQNCVNGYWNGVKYNSVSFIGYGSMGFGIGGNYNSSHVVNASYNLNDGNGDLITTALMGINSVESTNYGIPAGISANATIDFIDMDQDLLCTVCRYGCGYENDLCTGCDTLDIIADINSSNPEYFCPGDWQNNQVMLKVNNTNSWHLGINTFVPGDNTDIKEIEFVIKGSAMEIPMIPEDCIPYEFQLEEG
tara:strand:- start:19864 stop:22092 length:2229 start_codon:yes stop_codon:yes gene_type:complete